MSGQLFNKIQSYSPQTHIELDQTPDTVSPFDVPTDSGTLPISGTMTYTGSSGGAIIYVADAPIGAIGGSWQVPWGGSTSTARAQATLPLSGTTHFNDNDYSGGFWFKLMAMPIGTNRNVPIYQHQPLGSTTNNGFQVSVEGSSATVPGQISFRFVTGVPAYSGVVAQPNVWYYAAIIKTDTGTNRKFDYYLNGSFVGSQTTAATNANATALQLGATTSVSFGNFEVRYSNIYYHTSTAIGPTQIAEIWTAGSTSPAQNINFTTTAATASALQVLPTISTTSNSNNLESPATASALLVPPTIAVQTGDNVQVTTVILVNIEFAPATVSTQKFININVGPATAYSELINNIIVGSSNSVDFGAQEFFASAILVKPFLSESPMFASAQSGNHTVYVDPNYFNAVTQLNPYLYINNGATAGSIVNYGSQTGTFTRGADFSTLQDGGAPLNLVREGDSWRGVNKNNSKAYLEFTTSNASQNPAQLIASGNFAFEFWAKPLAFPSTATSDQFGGAASFTNKSFLESDALSLRLSPVNFGDDTRSLELVIKNTSSATVTLRIGLTSSGVLLNNWNHIVVNVYQSGINASQRLVQVWVNGSVRINETISFTAWTNSDITTKIIGSDSQSLNFMADGFFDEIAWYSEELTNSEIINHYQLISTLSPNFTDFPEEATASAQSGTHQFTVTSNAIPEIKEATASALLVAPTTIAGISFTHNAAPMTASATILIPAISTSNTILATPAIAYAEAAPAYQLNSIYYDYVQANIMPYRYVTFDAANALADYGTDNDYSVQATVVGGTIVNPDEGISGKSAKTAGLSYVTDGIILKESEYNDTWGTTGNEYHAAFWIEKAPEDNSTGLRVIWNLNGHYNNEHIILYQYQGKLTLSFNDGTINFINQTTVNNVNLFDGQRHFVVINVNHVGVNDSAYLYVDGVVVMTVSLGSYRVETINGITNVGPNDEANNYPRMSVGCLITPLESTSLPVVPTNTKIIADEIYWAKTAINQTGVTALFNVMPDKNNTDYMADPMEATALFVNPATSTTVNYLTQAANASALINNVIVTADRNIINLTAPANASAEFLGAQRLDNFIFAADIMVATAIFNSGGVIITRSGGPMLATVTLIDRPGDDGDGYWGGIATNTNVSGVNISSWYVLSPWAAWLRATDVHGVMPMSEVK